MERKREVYNHVKILIEAIPASVTLWDKNDVLIDCNIEAVKLFGFTEKEKFFKAFGERFFDFSPKYQPCGTPTKIKLKEFFKQAWKQGRLQVEWMHLDINGHEMPFNATLARIEIEGELMLLICDTDLREIGFEKAKKVEAEHSLLKLEIEAVYREKEFKDDILATLSHEIRTPLAVVSAYAQVTARKIRSGEINERVLQALDTISDEAKRLGELATDTMDMFIKKSEIEARTSVDINKLIDRLVNILASTAKKKNITILLNLPKYLPPVHGSSNALMRVLWNILENAIRYTEGGAIIITGDFQSSGNAAFVSVTISDTGCGMTDEVKKRAFERGYSGRKTTGLGLAFCKEIIEMHDGEISIESEAGKGCAITFSLPHFSTKESSNA